MLKWRIALLIASLGRCGVMGQSESLTPSTTTTDHPSPITARAEAVTEDPFIGFVVVSATNLSSINRSNSGPLNCQTRQIFPTYGIGDPVLMPLCASSGEVDLIYRTVPTTSSLALPLTAVDTTGALATRPPMMVTIMNGNGYPEPAQAAGSGRQGANGSNDSLSPNIVGIIVGSVFGSVAIVALAAVAFFYGRRQERERRAAENQHNWKIRPETPDSWDDDSNVSVAGSKRRYSNSYRSRPIELSRMPRGRR
ncbi:hypothetical protein Daesc_006132 [Daldinia eschscholtzii]|uniref:Mid2 domain-containing protein n=1 Tax=Daldinia eschscholtzii TaxID=292717 RepID=A0AAX6MG32_9PEZI